MEVLLPALLNGLSWGLLLFLLAGGLTLVLGMMGVLNFAHASFYMLGAYLGWQIAAWLGFWPAFVIAPLLTGVLGALVQRLLLRRLAGRGHAAELLLTFGLAWVIGEAVQLAWGRAPLAWRLPPELSGNLFTLYGAGFPVYRGFMMAVALLMLGGLALFLARARLGLVIRAAVARPHMVEALGHDVPRLHTLVFGVGTGLAGLAGVLGGMALVTEPGMAESLGSIVFVVVVAGGLGSLGGAFVAALAIGLIQTLAVALDVPLAQWLPGLATAPGALAALADLSLAQVAPLLPYLLLIVLLLVRPQGLSARAA